MTTLDPNKEFRKPVLLAAGIVGLVQAACWTVLSLLSILCYNDVITDGEEVNIDYEYFFYNIFHHGYEDFKKYNIIVKPLTFNIIMYFYVSLSFLWIWLSSHLIWGMIRHKWTMMIHTVKCWVGITMFISLLDLTFACLLAIDYYSIFSKIENNEESRYSIMAMQAIYGAVISLAARGYVLWIVNVVFCFILGNFAIQMQKEDRPARLSFIDAFAATGIPRFDTGNANEGFVPDNSETSERSSFNPLSVSSSLSNNNIQFSKPNVEYNKNPERSAPTTYVSTPPDFSKPNPEYNRSPEYFASANVPRQPTVDRLRSYATESLQQSSNEQPRFDRVAKIGKSWGRRTPPQNVSPPSVPKMPFIPAPDYTPPSSPRSQPKSVLRANSKYTY